LSQKDKGRGLYRILAGSRAAEIDRKAIADGIDSKKLMKNAGTGAAEEIVFDYPVFVKYPILQYNPEDSGIFF
jgi:NAD(P)H-hydrate repair Nnr-like enzyme with NAD(P)H-hydrate epimerase domain